MRLYLGKSLGGGFHVGTSISGKGCLSAAWEIIKLPFLLTYAIIYYLIFVPIKWIYQLIAGTANEKKNNNQIAVRSDASALLREAQQHAQTINSTVSIEEFSVAMQNLENAMKNLIVLHESGKVSMTPSPRENLDRVHLNMPETINAFIDRTVATMPQINVQQGEALTKFLDDVEADEYIGGILVDRNKMRINALRKTAFVENYATKQLDLIDHMEGHDFEYWCADLLRKLGYSGVEVTRGSGDQGIDILAEKDGIRYAIQCKCYSHPLGNTPVQEAFSGKSLYKCHLGVVMTNQTFTAGGKECAEATGVLLWGRDKIKEFLETVERNGANG